MNFVTFNILNRIIVSNLYKLPHDIDIVAGVPRSGLLAANIIACYLNKPLTDIDNILAGKLYEAGFTKNKSDWIRDISEAKKILIVEYSVASGHSLLTAKDKLKSLNIEQIYLSIIVAPESQNIPDIFFAIVPFPRIFEWNYMHHTFLRLSCVDLDGVLCEDPTAEQNDDGDNYRNFCLNAIPKLIPSQPIGCIVTARLQKYSFETQQWLNKYKIRYDNLIMLNLNSAEERRRLNIHSDYKAQVYQHFNNAILFIESSFEQAKNIAKLSNKDVFCVENSAFIPGGDFTYNYFLQKKFLFSLILIIYVIKNL